MTSLRRTPGSSNVYGYFFERESRRSGILYVIFRYTPDGILRGDGPGPTCAYYDVPVIRLGAEIPRDIQVKGKQGLKNVGRGKSTANA